MLNRSRLLALLLTLLVSACATSKPPLQAPLPLQVPAPPPELMTPVEPGLWSQRALGKFKEWLRYLTNESNSL